MTAGGGVDVQRVLGAFAAVGGDVCCGMYVGGGHDGEGNGEPPSCCGQPFRADDLRQAREFVGEWQLVLRRLVQWNHDVNGDGAELSELLLLAESLVGYDGEQARRHDYERIPAIAELIAADREYDEARALWLNYSREDHDALLVQLDNARARRASALAAMEQN